MASDDQAQRVASARQIATGAAVREVASQLIWNPLRCRLKRAMPPSEVRRRPHLRHLMRSMQPPEPPLPGPHIAGWNRRVCFVPPITQHLRDAVACAAPNYRFRLVRHPPIGVVRQSLPGRSCPGFAGRTNSLGARPPERPRPPVRVALRHIDPSQAALSRKRPARDWRRCGPARQSSHHSGACGRAD